MRVFIAIAFPEELRSELERSAAALRRVCRRGSFSARDNYHLTLAFLGEVPEERLEAVRTAMDRCAGPAIPIAVGPFGSFRGREGDTLWRRIDAPEPLYVLQRRLSAELRERGFVLEKRAFRPHLTLARRAVTGEGVKLEELSARLRSLSFTAEEMTLFRSDQLRGRRVYTPLYVRRFTEGSPQ